MDRWQGQASLALVVALVVSGCASQETPPISVDTPLLRCPEPCVVPIDQGTRWEPAVSVDPADPRRVVAASIDQGVDASGRRYSWPLAHVSHDGGATWTTRRLPMGSDQAPNHPMYLENHADDPAVLFLADGTLLYTALTFDFISVAQRGLVMTSPSIGLWRSTDGGRTFPEARVLHRGSGASSIPEAGYVEYDKQWLAQGADGTVLLAWNTNEGSTGSCPGSCTRLFTAASRDGGRSWGPPSVVYDGVASGAFPLVLRDGTWVVSYRETGAASIHVAVSNDRGASWTTNTSIDSTTKFPVLATTAGPGASGERIYMAYPRTSERRGQPDVPQVVTVRWSDDEGHTWGPAVVLQATQASARTSPAIAALDGNAVVSFWYPEGTDGLQARLHAVAVSATGTLSAPLVLDTHEGPTRTTGDYMGLAASPEGGNLFAVWNARHGSQHVVTGARILLVRD